MKVEFDSVLIGKTYSVVFLPGRDAERFFKCEIVSKDDEKATGVIDRRVLLINSEIKKGQTVYLYKNKNHFYERPNNKRNGNLQ